MKWHIVGSDGYIAGKLLRRLNGQKGVVRYSMIQEQGDVLFNLLDLREDVFQAIQPGDFVVFLAAISSPDMCEKEYDRAFEINVTGTEEFLRACMERGANTLFLSSDVVNGPTQSVHNELSEVFPFGKYGQMKREIEKRFANEPQFKAFRLSYVFSAEDRFMKYLCQCAGEGKKAEVFRALYRNVVYIEDILDAMIALSRTYNQWDNMLFNLSGPELLCREDMARLFKRSIDASLQYDVCLPDDEFFRARPNTIATESLYLGRLLGRKPMTIEDAMKREFRRS